MAWRRRDQIPPYEIMGRTPRGEGAAEGEPKGGAAPKASASGRMPAAESMAGLGEWLRTWNEPVVLRTPKGVAALVLAGVLGLLVLAYWVGHSRGDAAAAERIAQELADRAGLSHPRLPPRGGGAASSGEASGDTASPSTGGGEAPATRRAGLNYFVLAHNPPEQAEALVRFLATYGVEAAVIPGHNTGLAKVVALRGFSRDQLVSDGRREYEARLRRIGREWKAANGNKGKDLSDLYLELYKGD